MKWVVVIFIFLLSQFKGVAQSFEVQQLLLNVEKLAQLKEMLADLKKGYEIVYKGYTNIKDISEGNFNLHQVFLDGLLEVSPIVKNYKKVSGIISMQLKIVQEYKAAIQHFRESKAFTVEELEYLYSVYSNLFERSKEDLETLLTIITSGVFRMSDDERLNRIDVLFSDMSDKLFFLRHFNQRAQILLVQREQSKRETEATQNFFGINP